MLPCLLSNAAQLAIFFLPPWRPVTYVTGFRLAFEISVYVVWSSNHEAHHQRL
jgi:hypothetical protein